MPALISMKGTRRYTVQSPTTEDNDSSDLDVVTPAPFSGNVHETRRRHNIPLDTIYSTSRIEDSVYTACLSSRFLAISLLTGKSAGKDPGRYLWKPRCYQPSVGLPSSVPSLKRGPCKLREGLFDVFKAHVVYNILVDYFYYSLGFEQSLEIVIWKLTLYH